MAKGFSEAVARQLVDHWDTAHDLSRLATRDPGFKKFVIRHVNKTLDEWDLKKIGENAATHCPNSVNALYRDLRRQAEAP